MLGNFVETIEHSLRRGVSSNRAKTILSCTHIMPPPVSMLVAYKSGHPVHCPSSLSRAPHLPPREISDDQSRLQPSTYGRQRVPTRASLKVRPNWPLYHRSYFHRVDVPLISGEEAGLSFATRCCAQGKGPTPCRHAASSDDVRWRFSIFPVLEKRRIPTLLFCFLVRKTAPELRVASYASKNCGTSCIEKLCHLEPIGHYTIIWYEF